MTAMKVLPVSALLMALLVTGGCVSLPTGPSVTVLPGSNRSFSEFRRDDADCREYAYEQIGGRSAQQRANDSAVSSAAVGTVVGAAAGAALGGSRGAGVGAGTGLLFGSAIGADAAQSSAYGSQRRYDNAYVQCMYASGHRVPMSGRYATGRSERYDRYDGGYRDRDYRDRDYRGTPPPPPEGMPPPPPPY
ncbi:YMGG-like glycine zipper-containing protein [Azoarcus sp. KH32C]|uniref:YMGG-like glycine zipper-containing protein n=1 Tax=Azoarcus sp. KH32C TaxID=748247 RepID=UPI000238646F|nr:YMGG-like glycine zipper-containing protein [Azoarcus sp. KH32C]BAL22533.1 proline-rich region [Azoarcus sp. KH32C]